MQAIGVIGACLWCGRASRFSQSGVTEEVEVAAGIGLEDVVHVEAAVAADRRSGRGRGGRPTVLQLTLRHEKIEGALLHAEADAVARAHQAEGAAAAASGATWSTMVPKAVPLMRASEMRTMSVTPARRSFSGIGR